MKQFAFLVIVVLAIIPFHQASNASLSCYECLQNSTGTPSISCSAPKQKKCGEVGPGMPYDRCFTVKATVKNPNTGALVDQEMKDCGLSYSCSGNMLCNSMNSTGNYTKCDALCCEGNLCNGGLSPTSGQTTVGPSATGGQPQTTVGPSATGGQTTVGPSPTGSKAGQTPVSGILVLISIVMAMLFK